ncbi:MAG: 2-oxoacid:acceptor oxidoreductase subunit alpha [candidate division WS1 bacterium]|jgi:2-oxoglutarate ferredoxin oxidoreductase subunit alpha|nr:2-oxoacid:acceptor oxidoreductase subunit alpha [candidate division WS1 bacterium]
MDLNIRIAGEAGQGIKTTGHLLVDVFASMGLWVFSTQSYMSRIRGGLNWQDVRVADYRITSSRDQADLLVALTEEALETLRAEVAEDGLILYDGDEAQDAVAINFTKTAKDEGGSAIMANSVAGGAIFTILGYDIKPLIGYLDEAFHAKGVEVVKTNAALVRRGAELASDLQGRLPAPQPSDAPPQVYDGTEATALSAAVSGVKFIAAYPMTPSTGVFTWLAKNMEKYGIIAEQAEDEIAAINMICGATYAGVPAIVTTSGGGLALMSEGLSLAGMHELPAVVMLGQRPGPATGLPTRTAQGDLLFALRTGHGEFPRALFAPGSPRQCLELMRRALETAHKFQTPVIYMMDQYLADLRLNEEERDETPRPIDRQIVTDAGGDYRRYEITDSGVSPRAIPSGDAFVVLDSDEHDEEGHITENLEIAQAMMDKRMRKIDGMIAEALPPEAYRDDEGAGTLLICWGSTYLPCREAVDILRMNGHNASMLHFGQIWPLNRDAVREAIGSRERVISVEGNAWGQFACVLREQGLIGEVELLTRYDGLPFTAEEIVARVEG